MKHTAHLLDALYFTPGTQAKTAILHEYWRLTPDPERGFTTALIAGALRFPRYKRGLLLALAREQIDATLLAMSHAYVGELAETIAHLWPSNPEAAIPLPLLSEAVALLQTADTATLRSTITGWMHSASPHERWLIAKLSGGNLRIGISSRMLKHMLASYGKVDINDIESIWHSISPPYRELFDWLEGRSDMPTPPADIRCFQPVMLAHPYDASSLPSISPNTFAAEYKYDGARVQLVSNHTGASLFSRSGEDMSAAFPDIIAQAPTNITLDGELLIAEPSGAIAGFHALQQRLNRKQPTRALLQKSPAFLMLYDIMRYEGTDYTSLPFEQRRAHLDAWAGHGLPSSWRISPLIAFSNADDLAQHRLNTTSQAHCEGLMLKRWDSPYLAGRPTGQWYKWKRDPLTFDAVMLYAQRGSGKRSSLYSDFTFGVWDGEVLLPIAKAYFGFTDRELGALDAWVRKHSMQSFGPVREVEKLLVCELACDSIHPSTRHKSGIALRFPRIHRIRWDKPAHEADTLQHLRQLTTCPCPV